MDKEQFLASGLIEQYVLGLTTPEESREVERFVKAYPEIQEEIDALRHAVERYASQYALPPSPQLKEKIISEIEQEQLQSKASPTSALVKRMRWQLAAVTTAAFLTIAWMFWRQNQLQNRYHQLSRDFESFQIDCQNLQKQQQRANKAIALLQESDSKVVHLEGTALQPKTHAIVYWNEKNHRAYLDMVNMPTPPPNKQYQIWAEVNGEMINAGLLADNTNELQTIEVIDKAASLNITIEPTGGSLHPTVALLVASGKI